MINLATKRRAHSFALSAATRPSLLSSGLRRQRAYASFHTVGRLLGWRAFLAVQRVPDCRDGVVATPRKHFGHRSGNQQEQRQPPAQDVKVQQNQSDSEGAEGTPAAGRTTESKTAQPRYALFDGKRLIIHNYRSPKAREVETIQIEGKGQRVTQLTQVNSRKSLSEWKQATSEKLAETYLPADYPDSVTKEYWPFTKYSMIGSVSITAMMFLSTQSLFVALGGSTSQAQLAAAAYTWVLKDGIGQLGGILFASRYGQNFDEDIKKWRFMAMLALNISIYIEIMTLAFPRHFLALASIANVGKNICFLLAAASRASINVRFAKRNNMGDISGKSVSQFTTSSLLGMGLGTMLSQVINISSIPQLVPTFALLSAVNLYTAYKTAAIIDEVHLNNQRAKLFFDAYFKQDEDDGYLSRFGNTEATTLPTMAQTNAREYFTLPTFANPQSCRYIRFGEKAISQVLSESKPNYFTTSVLHQLHKDGRVFCYHVDLLPHYKRALKKLVNNGREYVIHINMRQNCTNTDQLSAYYFARLLDLELKRIFTEQKNGAESVSYYRIQEAMRQAEIEFSEVDISTIEDLLRQQGWSLEYLYLDRKKNRYSVQEEIVEHVNKTE